MILIFSRLQAVGSSRFDRGEVSGMPVDLTEAALARARWIRCPISFSDDTPVVVKLHPGTHARTQAEVTVSPSLVVFVVQIGALWTSSETPSVSLKQLVL